MKKANIFRIVNNSEKSVLFLPKDKRLRSEIGYLIEPGTFKTVDYINSIYVLDLDKFYFQFVGDQLKINTNKIKNFNVFLEWDYYEPRAKQPYDNHISIN